jgi:hypothetical protein
VQDFPELLTRLAKVVHYCAEELTQHFSGTHQLSSQQPAAVSTPKAVGGSSLRSSLSVGAIPGRVPTSLCLIRQSDILEGFRWRKESSRKVVMLIRIRKSPKTRSAVGITPSGIDVMRWIGSLQKSADSKSMDM